MSFEIIVPFFISLIATILTLLVTKFFFSEFVGVFSSLPNDFSIFLTELINSENSSFVYAWTSSGLGVLFSSLKCLSMILAPIATEVSVEINPGV